MNEMDTLPLDTLAVQFARSFLIDFITFTYPQYSPQWYHELLCNKLDEMINGDITKLMVFMPPQHGKSEIVSRRFPAYLLGRIPTASVASCSYSSDLSARLNRSVQRIIDDEKYRLIFPDTMLNGKRVAMDSRGAWTRNTEEFEIVGHGGSYKSVGVMGPLTGNKVDFGIIDDPLKDRMEANSETIRNRQWEWYTDVFKTRLHNDSRVLLTMTRWHADDLAGRIMNEESGWQILSIPAIKEDNNLIEDKRNIGDPLWPDRHSLEKLKDTEKMSPSTFASMYQQRPSPAEGGIFKHDWWKFWDRLPEGDARIIQSWDLTFKGGVNNDWVVGQVWAIYGASAYLIDQVRGKWDFPDTVKQIRMLKKQHENTSQILVEEKANGAAVISTLKHEIAGIIPINPKESKEARASSVSYLVESGNVFLPKNAIWKDAALYELSVFPNGANDDVVDSLTQALYYIYKHKGAMLSYSPDFIT